MQRQPSGSGRTLLLKQGLTRLLSPSANWSTKTFLPLPNFHHTSHREYHYTLQFAGSNHLGFKPVSYRKGVYIDGCEREDVKHWEKYLHTMATTITDSVCGLFRDLSFDMQKGCGLGSDHIVMAKSTKLTGKSKMASVNWPGKQYLEKKLWQRAQFMVARGVTHCQQRALQYSKKLC